MDEDERILVRDRMQNKYALRGDFEMDTKYDTICSDI